MTESQRTPVPRSMLRVVIAEDHVLFAESLELALCVEGYEASRFPLPDRDGLTAATLSAILRTRPRVVILDLDLGSAGDGVHWIHPLARAGVNVVVVTSDPDRARWGEAMSHGARTVLSKSRPLNEVLAVIRRINQGLPVTSPRERDSLLAAWRERQATEQGSRARIGRLSRREREVLGQLMAGHTVSEIASSAVVSPSTVRSQVKAILAKLEVSSQLAAVGLAHRIGWTPPVA